MKDRRISFPKTFLGLVPEASKMNQYSL